MKILNSLKAWGWGKAGGLPEQALATLGCSIEGLPTAASLGLCPWEGGADRNQHPMLLLLVCAQCCACVVLFLPRYLPSMGTSHFADKETEAQGLKEVAQGY